jgi:GTP-binding protein HflX
LSRAAQSTADLTGERRETCVLVGVHLSDIADGGDGIFDYTPEESLDELAELAAGAGAQVLGSTLQTRRRPDPATLIGSGKVEEVKNWALERDAGFVLFDQSLSASQQRNLEKALDRRVLDRTQLILDIFAGHARTREGKLQVELAQLTYLLPRLMGRGAEMSRLGGGIGTRGPGETKLETDRRRIAVRIDKLKADLARVRSTRRLQRKKRSAVPLSTIALVGYTNAGKSTLFNALTAAHVVAEKRMFATLDPTIRALELASRRRVLLSDTVGFIRNLPTTLVESFRATLEEVTEAAMILHLVDLSSPHWRQQMAEVDRLLGELGAAETPQLLVLNKCDLIGAADAAAVAAAEQASGRRSGAVAVSAKTGQGLAELSDLIERTLPDDPIERVEYRFTHDQGEKLSFLYDHARVVERCDSDAGVTVVAEASQSVRRRLEEFACG